MKNTDHHATLRANILRGKSVVGSTPGGVAMVGENFAVLQPDRLSTGGFAPWIVSAILRVLALPQLHNRFRVQIQWSCLAGQRNWRLVAQAPRAIDLIEQKSVS